VAHILSSKLSSPTYLTLSDPELTIVVSGNGQERRWRGEGKGRMRRKIVRRKRSGE
jgi:hypothetical protein